MNGWAKDLKGFKLKWTGSFTALGARDCLIPSISMHVSEAFLLWCFAASAKVRARFVWGDLVDCRGEAIGMLRSVRLRESSKRSFSAGLISTKLGGAGTCARWLELLSVVVASLAVLKSLLVTVLLCLLWMAVLGIG